MGLEHTKGGLMRENNSLTNSKPWLSISALLVVAIWSRALPHPANMTAVVPAAVLAGYFLSNLWLATLVPLAALAISDVLFFSFYPGIEYVYVATLVAMLLGRFVARKTARQKTGILFLSGLVSSVLFFVISNLGVWLATNLYPRTWEGLVQCYVMAVPFFRHQIIGDVVYGVVLFIAIRFALSFVTKNATQANS